MKTPIKKLTSRLLLGMVCFAFCCAGCSKPSPPPVQRVESPQRLISTVPSITEILFDIGIGDRIVGDSRFTTYPPETKTIEKIGGLNDTNWEKIISLNPDLLLMLVGKEICGMDSPDLGGEILLLDHRSIDGVLESYDLIGERFGSEVMQGARKFCG